MAGFSGITYVNGVTPASAANMQRIDDFIEQLEGDAGVVTLNGSTSGTAKLYQILQGKIKRAIIRLDNFRNGGGSAQTLTFPVPFTDGAGFWCWDFPAFQVTNSGSAVTVYMMTGISSTGFSVTSVTTIDYGNVIFHTGGASAIPFDKISFNGSFASAKTGHMIIDGI
jgi:hypothetical protein